MIAATNSSTTSALLRYANTFFYLISNLRSRFGHAAIRTTGLRRFRVLESGQPSSRLLLSWPSATCTAPRKSHAASVSSSVRHRRRHRRALFQPAQATREHAQRLDQGDEHVHAEQPDQHELRLETLPDEHAGADGEEHEEKRRGVDLELFERAK